MTRARCLPYPASGGATGGRSARTATRSSWTSTLLTTTPNPLVGTIKHERMPVLLTKPEELEQWLRGTPGEALELAREYPPEPMRIAREGLDKEDPCVDAP